MTEGDAAPRRRRSAQIHVRRPAGELSRRGRARTAQDPDLLLYAVLHRMSAQVGAACAHRRSRRPGCRGGWRSWRALKKCRSGLSEPCRCSETCWTPPSLAHDLRVLQRRREARKTHLWPWRRVAGGMKRAGLDGPQAVISVGIPLNMVAPKWLGHAQLSPTAIYADAVGAEEQAITACMHVRMKRSAAIGTADDVLRGYVGRDGPTAAETHYDGSSVRILSPRLAPT